MKTKQINSEILGNKGFLLLESIISLAFIMTLVLILNNLVFQSMNIKKNVEDKVELQQQAGEITKHIEDLIGESKGIISIKARGIERDNIVLSDVTSIKCKYRDEKENKNIKDKELSLKSNNKLFINTLNSAGNSEPGGYEIGDYIDNMYIKISEDNKYVDIKLQLSKNKQTYETYFKVYIINSNYKDDKIKKEVQL